MSKIQTTKATYSQSIIKDDFWYLSTLIFFVGKVFVYDVKNIHTVYLGTESIMFAPSLE